MDSRLCHCLTRSELCQAPLNLLSLISHRDCSAKIRTTDFDTLIATPAHTHTHTHTHSHAHSNAKRWTILISHYGTDFIRRRGIINQYPHLLHNALTHKTGYWTIHNVIPNVVMEMANQTTLFAIDDIHKC